MKENRLWRQSKALVQALVALQFLTGAATAPPKKTTALSIHPVTPHYFQAPDGKPVVLIGDYTWGTFSDVDFDFEAQFDALKANGLNFARVWLWWGCEQFPPPDDGHHIEPYLRPGPGQANDGRLKYDLGRFNAAFFKRLRDFCAAARRRGLFLQLITVDAWMLKHPHLWKLHAFHRDNNINGVDGDPRNTGKGTDGEQGFCSMANPKALEFQKACLPSGGAATLDLKKLAGPLTARWCNPREGKYSEEFKAAGDGKREFHAPDAGDWVLLLKQTRVP